MKFFLIIDQIARKISSPSFSPMSKRLKRTSPFARSVFALFAIKLQKTVSLGQQQTLLIATLGKQQTGRSRSKSGRMKLRSQSILRFNHLVHLLRAGDSKTMPGITEIETECASNHLQDGVNLGLSLRLEYRILGAGMRLLRQPKLAIIPEDPLRADGEAKMKVL